MGNAAVSTVFKCPACGANNRVRIEEGSGKVPVCGRCKTPLPVGVTEPVIITDASFTDVVEKSGMPVLLDMWAAWCGPCRMIAPVIETLAKEMSGRAVIGKLDVDANPRTAARFGVQSIPTLLILKGGREVDRLVGVQTKEAIIRRLEANL
jgi:thioredoxin